VNAIAQSALSTQYVQVRVQAVSPDGVYDPTSDTVAFAFTSASPPFGAPSEWIPGSWATYPGPQYWAQVLVGPVGGDITLAYGTWLGWLKITGSPEVPVLQPFQLQIT
jgi:hypothetical protein